MFREVHGRNSSIHLRLAKSVPSTCSKQGATPRRCKQGATPCQYLKAPFCRIHIQQEHLSCIILTTLNSSPQTAGYIELFRRDAAQGARGCGAETCEGQARWRTELSSSLRRTVHTPRSQRLQSITIALSQVPVLGSEAALCPSGCWLHRGSYTTEAEESGQTRCGSDEGEEDCEWIAESD